MSDEVRLAGAVGRGVKDQLGKFPKGKPPKSKKKKATKDSTYSNKGVGRKENTRVHHGEVVDEGRRDAHGAIDQGAIDVEWWPTPKEIGGSRKALPKPSPKAIEAPGTGPFVATPHLDLTPGPNFGGTVHEITKAKKPRQFDGL